jgi:polyphosphate kinase 2 (PPK2 family)
MLEKVDLTREIGKEEYKKRLPALQERLYELQLAASETGVASVVVFEGWDAAGKGTCINVLTSRLEPRAFRLQVVAEPRTDELRMPWLYRFWARVPNYGQMAIFDRSWYRRVLDERIQKITPKSEWQKAYRDITDFERTLADDGYIFVKLFLHISKKEQKRRLRKLESDPLTSWQVQPSDWKRHRQYGKYLVAVEEMLEQTESEWAPWTIVEATDRYWTRIAVFEAVIRGLESASARAAGSTGLAAIPAPAKTARPAKPAKKA